MNKDQIIIRVSKKLGEKINWYPDQKVSIHKNPYLDWSAHVFRADRTQYILITNTASLYSTVIYGRGITSDTKLLRRFKHSVRETLTEDGFQFIYRRFIAPATGTFVFSKALNQSVTGSMNDLTKNAQIYLTEKELSPFGTGLKLNEMPFSALDYSYPREAFQQLEAEKTGQDK